MSTINTKNLTAEERAELKKQLAAEEQQEKQKRKDDIKAFKELSEDFVTRNIDSLITYKTTIKDFVVKMFSDYESLKEIKDQVYGKREQDSHTSTLKDGSASITIGHNVVIKFDGTEASGVEMIKEYLASLVDDDENTKKLTQIVDIALKANKKTGMLNPSKIIELNSLRDDFNSQKFNRGLDIIIAAQIRTQNSMYVSGWKYVKIGSNPATKLEFRFTV